MKKISKGSTSCVDRDNSFWRDVSANIAAACLLVMSVGAIISWWDPKVINVFQSFPLFNIMVYIFLFAPPWYFIYRLFEKYWKFWHLHNYFRFFAYVVPPLILAVIVFFEKEKVNYPKSDGNLHKNTISVVMTDFCPLNPKTIFSSDYTKIDASRMFSENMIILNDSWQRLNSNIPFSFDWKQDSHVLSNRDVESLLADKGSNLYNVYITGEFFMKGDDAFVITHMIFKDSILVNQLESIAQYYDTLMLDCDYNKIEGIKNARFPYVKYFLNDLINSFVSSFKISEFMDVITFMSELNSSADISFHYILLLKNMANKDQKNTQKELSYLSTKLSFLKKMNKDSTAGLTKLDELILYIRLINIYCINNNMLPKIQYPAFETTRIISDMLKEGQITTRYPDYMNDFCLIFLYYYEWHRKPSTENKEENLMAKFFLESLFQDVKVDSAKWKTVDPIKDILSFINSVLRAKK